MKTYLVEPLLGVGPVRLGMSREAARQVMPEPPHTFRKTPLSKHDTDAFHRSSFQLFYAGELPAVEYIELSRSNDFRAVFCGQSVFEMPAEELLAILGRQHRCQIDDPSAPCDVIFPDLQISLWRPYAPDSPDDERARYFSTIGAGVTGYYPAA